jgi:hypothetical protein
MVSCTRYVVTIRSDELFENLDMFDARAFLLQAVRPSQYQDIHFLVPALELYAIQGVVESPFELLKADMLASCIGWMG